MRRSSLHRNRLVLAAISLELRGHLAYFPDPQFQLLRPFGRLATRGPPLQAATGELLQLGDERVGAERPAGAFRVAQGREQGESVSMPRSSAKRPTRSISGATRTRPASRPAR